MRFVFLVGGLVGFLLAAATSWACDHAPDRVFLDGAVGCLGGALLFRWFWTTLVGGIRETILARHEAGLTETPAPAAAAPAPTAATKTK